MDSFHSDQADQGLPGDVQQGEGLGPDEGGSHPLPMSHVLCSVAVTIDPLQ